MDYNNGAAFTLEEIRRAVKAKRAELRAAKKNASRKAPSSAKSKQIVDIETVER